VRRTLAASTTVPTAVVNTKPFRSRCRRLESVLTSGGRAEGEARQRIAGAREPSARLLVLVSPVPLRPTYTWTEDSTDHVLTIEARPLIICHGGVIRTALGHLAGTESR
jgi:hypothetical protein